MEFIKQFLSSKTHTMTSQQILQADILDILFENRNKTYGAYALRKTYHLRLLKALAITALFVVALLFFGSTSSTKTIIAKTNDSLMIIDIHPLPEKKPDPPKAKIQPMKQQPIKQENFQTQIRILDVVHNPPPKQDQLINAAISNQKVEGTPVVIQPPTPPAVTSGNSMQGEPEQKENLLPSRPPQFPGGVEAWRNFLSRYLQSPEQLEAGKKRTVLVRFWVDEEGNVTNFQVVQSGGAAFDNEVIRVLKKMPKWLPAIQNGKPVSISFTQPVTFTSIEE